MKYNSLRREVEKIKNSISANLYLFILEALNGNKNK